MIRYGAFSESPMIYNPHLWLLFCCVQSPDTFEEFNTQQMYSVVLDYTL